MDLSVDYLGLKLRNPLVPSACQPLTGDFGNIKKMEDAGAGAVVLHSLFEEQLKADQLELHEHTTSNTDSFAEATSFFPEPQEYLLGPEEYLEHIRKTKESVSIPVIASLNGSTLGGWTDFAKQMQQAGADAIELNIYSVPNNSDRTAEEIESQYTEILTSVKKQVSIPVAVKLSPFFTNLSHMAKRMDTAGADGLVLFNRFYQPDIDLEALEVRPDIILSSSLTLRLPLRWIAILYGNVKADLAATSGIHRTEDVFKVLMAGAKVAQVCSVLLKFGIERLDLLNKEMRVWMEKHEYDSINQMRGSMSQQNCETPLEFERAQYIRALHQFRPGMNRKTV